MSQPFADSPALTPAQGGSRLAGPEPSGEGWLPGPKPPVEGWTQRKFFLVLAFVLAFHVALIFLFGTKKQIVPRAVTNVPHLQLADAADELIALGDPTLFARPNAHDLVTAFWRRTPAIKPPSFDWTEGPRYLAPAPEDLGAVFHEFVKRSRAADFPLNFKPEPKSTAPEMAFDDTMPQATTLQISGDLGGRQLLNPDGTPCPTVPAGSAFSVVTPPIKLPLQRRNDVLEPSQVQALVDPAGNVTSVVVLQPTPDAAADQDALRLARNLRFAPAPRLTFGEITFIWHTVPLTTTNEPSR